MDTVARTQAVFRADRRAFARHLLIACCPVVAQEKRVSIISGIKLAEKTGPADGDEYLEFLKQLGLEYVIFISPITAMRTWSSCGSVTNHSVSSCGW
jgi:hypothetical protein